MNILKRELRHNLKAFIIWTVILAVTIYYVMTLYPSIAKDSASLDQLLKQLPDSLLKAFSLDRLSMTNILGYYSTEVGLFMLLGGAIYSMLLSTGVIAREHDDRTIEFLLSKPVTRNEIITSKLIAYTIYIFVFNLVISLTTYAAFESVKMESYPAGTLVLVFIGYFLVQITFANIGLLVSMFVTKRKSTTALGIWVVLGAYFISIIAGLAKDLEFLKYITPFKYADPADIILNGSIDMVYLLILLTVNIAAIAAAYMIYNRKNITT